MDHDLKKLTVMGCTFDLLAENDEGYHNLMKLVSLGHLEGFYYKLELIKIF